jgi:hypothetical protein
VSSAPPSFAEAYAAALADHLAEPGEASLLAAYEFARGAVHSGLCVLELAVVHQDALLAALETAGDDAEVGRVARAAGDFFLEALSAFEMIQRGFAEARQTALEGRRQTRLARQLSAFLADASLTADAQGALAEMLQLVAEQAREVLQADCCLATLATGDGPRTVEAASHADDEMRWRAFVRWLDLPALYGIVDRAGGSARAGPEELTRLAPFRRAEGELPLHGWLAASLTALDGTEMGAIQAFSGGERRFGEEDEAALVHLAQTASAAVERLRLYRG